MGSRDLFGGPFWGGLGASPCAVRRRLLVVRGRRKALLRYSIRRFKVNVRELKVMLTKLARERCGLNFLRTHRYDGARNGVRTVSRQAIASLPNVKLRNP